jgi:hypothetical protein
MCATGQYINGSPIAGFFNFICRGDPKSGLTKTCDKNGHPQTMGSEICRNGFCTIQ